MEIVAENLSEKEENSEEPQVTLFLIRENTDASSTCLVSQLVHTG